LINEELTKNFLAQVTEFWVNPEIKKREALGQLPQDFAIHRLMILLPKNGSPIVQFNDEISFTAKGVHGDGTPISPGEIVEPYNIGRIESVYAPEVDNIRVACIFMYWDGYRYNGFFDFQPNHQQISDGNQNWGFSDFFANYLQTLLMVDCVHEYNDNKDKLYKLGLWPAPSLMPYPIRKIIQDIENGNKEAAINTLVEHCNLDFIRNLMNEWWSNNLFLIRQKLIEESFYAHSHKLFHLSIHTLLPQFEGIISDWVIPRIDESKEKIPWRHESKTKKFRDMALNIEPRSYLYEEVVKSTSTFILEGPVLKSFKEWFEDLDSTFPGRHAVGHGRYNEALYTEENSIKVFLLLDTLYQIILLNPSLPSDLSSGTSA
jgi:hypothetical protein